MSFMPARVFISGAGLSYCCVYMMSGRHETFISGRHENFMSPFHAGMKSHAGMEMGRKSRVNTIFSCRGDMKTKSPSSRLGSLRILRANFLEVPSSRQDRERHYCTHTHRGRIHDVSSPTRNKNSWNQEKVRLGLTN